MKNDILLQIEALFENVREMYPECNLNGESITEVFGIPEEKLEDIIKLAKLMSFLYPDASEQIVQLLKFLRTGYDPAVVVLMAHACGFHYAAQIKR